MPFDKSEKTKLIKEARRMWKERGIPDAEKEMVLKYSKNITNNINKLEYQRLQDLVLSMREMTTEYLITGIYNLAFSNHLIVSKTQHCFNDEIILRYLYPDVKAIKTFSQLTYPQVYMSAVKLGNIYLKEAKELNN